MVKSKKMSKTGIAVIVLAILLVLSLVMGMTGAWYTANSSKENHGETYSFKMSEWLTLTPATQGAASISVTTRAGGDSLGAAEDVETDNGAFVVLPGDKIELTGGAIAGINYDSAVDFWYVASVESDFSDVDSSDLVRGEAGNGALVLPSLSYSSSTSPANFTTGSGLSLTVNQELSYSANASFTVSTLINGESSVTVYVRAIQYNNLTRAAAAEQMNISPAA